MRGRLRSRRAADRACPRGRARAGRRSRRHAVADVDLRHGAPAGLRAASRRAASGVEVDAICSISATPFCAQQRLGAAAERAPGGRVHHDLRHSLLHRQAGLLPRRDAAGEVHDVREAVLAQRPAAEPERLPVGADDDHRLLLVASRSPSARSRARRAGCCARSGCGPWRTRPASRTSSTSASFWFISSVASSVFDRGPAGAAPHERPDQHRAAHERDRDERRCSR